MPISTVGAEGCRRQRGWWWVGSSESCRGSRLDSKARRAGLELELGLKIARAPKPGPSRWILWKIFWPQAVVEGEEPSGKDRMHLLEMVGPRGGRCIGAVRYAMGWSGMFTTEQKKLLFTRPQVVGVMRDPWIFWG